jgi:hypothetical protein
MHAKLWSKILNGCNQIENKTGHTWEDGRAIAQAVSRWLPTAAGRILGWLSRICGGQIGAGPSFVRVLRFPLPIFIPSNSPTSESPGASTTGQLVVDMPSGISLDSTPHYANKKKIKIRR